MAQTNTSQPFPMYTFQVNLETVDRQGQLVPSSTQIASYSNETISEADEMKYTRTTFIPGLNNGDNVEYHHGDQFKAYGMNALYLLKTYVSNPASPSDLLSVVSGPSTPD